MKLYNELGYVIEGFPRDLSQAKQFELEVNIYSGQKITLPLYLVRL